MDPILSFIYERENPQREILLYLHELFTNQLHLEAKLRYKIPFYYNKSWICYLNPVKPQSIELAFPRGNELSNAQGLLEAKERKQVRGITFKQVKDIPRDALWEIMQEALILDETVPYASKRKKK